MDEEPNRPLELFRRDREHQLEWLQRHGAEVLDAAKLAYESGVLSVVQGIDRTALDNALQAVVESGVADRQGSDASRTAESQESSGHGPCGFATANSGITVPKTAEGVPANAAHSVRLGHKPAGRPIDLCSIEAYRIIVEGDESEEAYNHAFRHWCKQKQCVNPGKPERAAFKKAMGRMKQRMKAKAIIG